jgi:hypothetical protein
VIAPLGRSIVETADTAGGLTRHQRAAITVPLEDPLAPR